MQTRTAFNEMMGNALYHSRYLSMWEDEDSHRQAEENAAYAESRLEQAVEDLQNEDFEAMICESISESGNDHLALLKAAIDSDDAIELLRLIKTEYESYTLSVANAQLI